MSFPGYKSPHRAKLRPLRIGSSISAPYLVLPRDGRVEAICTNPFGCGVGARPFDARADLRNQTCNCCKTGACGPHKLKPWTDFRSCFDGCVICRLLFFDEAPSDWLLEQNNTTRSQSAGQEQAAEPQQKESELWPNLSTLHSSGGSVDCWLCGFNRGAALSFIKSNVDDAGNPNDDLERLAFILKSCRGDVHMRRIHEEMLTLLGPDAAARIDVFMNAKAQILGLLGRQSQSSQTLLGKLNEIDRVIRGLPMIGKWR